MRGASILAICASALAGCVTTGGETTRLIKSDPPGATVEVEGYGSCETPCSIRIDQRRLVTIGKTGYRAQRFLIGPKGATVNVKLDYIAGSDGVDEQALPSID